MNLELVFIILGSEKARSGGPETCPPGGKVGRVGQVSAFFGRTLRAVCRERTDCGKYL